MLSNLDNPSEVLLKGKGKMLVKTEPTESENPIKRRRGQLCLIKEIIKLKIEEKDTVSTHTFFKYKF